MDENTFKILSLVISLISTLGLAFIGYLTIKANRKVEKIAVTTRNTERRGEATHTLVNSNMGIQLSVSYAALRRVADLTKDSKDEEIADKARDALEEHAKQQDIVDDRPSSAASSTGNGG